MYDTFIYPGDTNVDRDSEWILKAGVEKQGDNLIPNRTLIKFELPELGTGSEVINASLTLTPYGTDTEVPEEKIAAIHCITSDWSESTANWNGMHDKFNNKIESLLVGTRRTGTGDTSLNAYLFYNADITNLVKKWYRDTNNYGLMIKAIDESQYEDEDFPIFYSKNNNIYGADPRPVIGITYRNQNGIENYMDYKVQSFTDGNTYINTYNGNMTASFNIGHTIGGRLPVKLKLYYNTNDIVLEKETFFGKGFKLNVEQTIKEVEISELKYQEYVDEDGTVHYFYKESEDSNVYYDEDGLNLKLEKEDNYWIMTNKNNNGNMKFIEKNGTYYLSELRDADNNIITIELDESNRVISLKDIYEESVEIVYETNTIKIISSEFTTQLNFNNGQIVSIQNALGTKNIEYNQNNLISSITDINGLKFVYEYFEQKPYKIRKVSHYGLNNTLGQYISFEYGFDSTRIIDSSESAETIIYNSQGNVISINSLKSAENIEGAYSLNQDFNTAEGNSNNRLTSRNNPITYIKNLLENTSFETDIENFVKDEDSSIVLSYNTECSHSGLRSLKATSLQAGQSIEYNVEVPKGEYYTFSGYFKASEPVEISLSYVDATNEKVTSCQIVEYSNDFQRNDVTIYYDEFATTDLKISISFGSIGELYIDDIQLETGEVANLYNMLENSDFSHGLADWNCSCVNDELTSSMFNVIKFNDNKNSALKVSMNPKYGSSFSKRIPINGKKGDLYTVSFWYKNEGVPVYRPHGGTYVTINFHPTDGEAEYCFGESSNFNSNGNLWQYFSYTDYALEDFDEVYLYFVQQDQANDFYITNISLYHNITSGFYDYDENGNMISVQNQMNDGKTFSYDEKNQLVKIHNQVGADYTYEYDNNKPDRIINIISSDGLSNKIKYDSNGNPIMTKVSKLFGESIESGKYKIRAKGTNKYLKAELNLILLEENDCSNTIWYVERENEDYKIKYDLNQQYSISYNDSEIILLEEDANKLFSLVKNEDESYYIINKDNGKYLKVSNEQLMLDNFTPDNNFKFYIEMLEEEFIENNIKYTSNGKFIEKVIDSNLNSIIYNINNVTGTIESKTDEKNNVTNYVYDNKNRLVQTSKGNRIVTYNYNIENMLNSINQDGNQFNFLYDNFLNLSSISMGNQVLSTNEYDLKNNITKVLYGNNNEITYEYDDYNRIKNINRMDFGFDYKYDNNGNLAKVIFDNGTIKYFYDKANRINVYKNNDFSINYTYDSNNNICNKKLSLGENKYNIENTFDENNKIVKTKNNNIDFNYAYDSFGRIIGKNINEGYNIEYQYAKQGKRTSEIIKSLKNGNNIYNYSYDAIGNISQVYCNNNLIKSYSYNQYNELTREDDYIKNIKYLYNYSDNGNLTSKEKIDILTDETIQIENYNYENENWKSQLTSYNGINIGYDGIGNIQSIGENINISWINGRMMASYTDNTNNMNIQYQYNEDGIRNKKIVNGNITKYNLEGNNIIFEQRGTNLIYYLYDITGIVGMKYNNNVYFYLKNLQGDIIEILDNDYNRIAKYEYDSWGNILSIKDNNDNEITDNNHIALINPFRYRSYYYDTETQLYYLNARYYSPKLSRFISIDSQFNRDDNLIGYNLYCYGGNNPVNTFDPMGNAFMFVTAAIGAIAGGIIGGVAAAKKGKNVWAGAAIGATAGGLIGLGAGAAASAIITGSATASTAVVLGTVSAKLAATQIPIAVSASKAIDWVSTKYEQTKSLLTGSTQIYRAVGSAELSDIKNAGQFNLPHGGLEVKQFTFSYKEALQFAKDPLVSGSNNSIVRASIPNSAIDQFFVSDTIDVHIFTKVFNVYYNNIETFNELVKETIKFLF